MEYADPTHQQLNHFNLESDHVVNEFQAFLFLRNFQQLSGTLFHVSTSIPEFPSPPAGLLPVARGLAEVIRGHVSINHLLDNAEPENVG